MPRKRGEPKDKTSVSVSQDATRLWDALEKKLGVSRSGIFEMAIRRLAQSEGIELQPSPGTAKTPGD